MKWEKVEINIQNIKYETAKAVLIACPHSSEYDEWSFWHPLKLVQDGSHSYSKYLVFNETFEFRLKKYGHNKFGKKKLLCEDTVGPEEIKEMFRWMPIQPPEYEHPKATNKPPKIDPVEIEAAEELIDNE